MKALSVRQPWAWLLIHGTKDIENREWRYAPSFRGQLAIHAAKGMTRAEYEDAVEFVRSFDAELASQIPAPGELVRGAIIGTMVLRKCVHDSPSPWFQGPLGLVMDSPEPWDDPISVQGALGLWDFRGEETEGGRDA